MDERFEKAVAFILEGDTEKVFYLTLLKHLCSKREGAHIEKCVDPGSGEVFYTINRAAHKVLVMFNIVGTISQIANSGNWFETRCYGRHKTLNWTVFLCYDTDNYTPNISKFYEGDWKELRKVISKHKSCSIIDLAAQADIEDIMLLDTDSVFRFLDMQPIAIPSASKGKRKMKKLFRAKGPGMAYHEGARAEPLIHALDLDKIMSSSPLPFNQIETECFAYCE